MTTATEVRPTTATQVYVVIDVAATFLFAVEGARAGVIAHLDLLGVLVVGFATALVGGVIRDLLLGDTPPAAFRSPARIIAALSGGLIAFLRFSATSGIPTWILTTLDALALGLFAVTGADKALQHKSNAWVVVMLGTITAVGGGVVRDVLLNQVPVVLVANIYASAAAAGAFAMVVAGWLKAPRLVAMGIGLAVCVTIRLLSVAFGWHLPTAS